MKFFAISLGLLVGSAYSEPLRNYNVNYGNLNGRDYSQQLLESERYDDPAYSTYSRYQNTNHWGTQQQPLNYNPNAWNNPYKGNAGQQQIPLTYPVYGAQNTVGQTQMNTNYDTFGNQQPVKEEWIVPVKMSPLYQYRNQQNQLKTFGNNAQPPVKTTYYNK